MKYFEQILKNYEREFKIINLGFACHPVSNMYPDTKNLYFSSVKQQPYIVNSNCLFP